MTRGSKCAKYSVKDNWPSNWRGKKMRIYRSQLCNPAKWQWTHDLVYQQWFMKVICNNKLQLPKPLEWSFKLVMHPQFCRLRSRCHLSRKLSPQQLFKIMSLRFGRLRCFPLGTHSILLSSANNRSCCSSWCIVPCPTSHRRERQQSDGGRDTCKFSPSQPAPSPRRPDHLTFNCDSRKQATGMPLTFILSGTVLLLDGFCLSAPWQFKPRTGWFLNPTMQRGS